MRVDWLLWISAGTQLLLVILGAVVSLQEEWAKKNKWVLIATFTALGMAGIYASNQQSLKSAREGAEANGKLSGSLSDLERSTKEIARLQNLNTDLQQRLLTSSRTITDLSKETLAQTTGGDSFPDVFPVRTDSCGGLGLAVVAHGKHNLLDLSVGVQSHMQRVDPASWADRLNSAVGVSVPMVWGNHMEELAICIHPESDPDMFQINTRARNGEWVEMLTFKKAADGWTSTRIVSDWYGHNFLKQPK